MSYSERTDQQDNWGDSPDYEFDYTPHGHGAETAEDHTGLAAYVSRLFVSEPTFLGVDTHVVWDGQRQELFARLQDSLDWSPFTVKSVDELPPIRLQRDNTYPSKRRWVCHFQYHGRAQDAPPYVSSLLDCVDHISPWYIAEKKYSNTAD